MSEDGLGAATSTGMEEESSLGLFGNLCHSARSPPLGVLMPGRLSGTIPKATGKDGVCAALDQWEGSRCRN
jgi:hypothetical protein